VKTEDEDQAQQSHHGQRQNRQSIEVGEGEPSHGCDNTPSSGQSRQRGYTQATMTWPSKIRGVKAFALLAAKQVALV